MTTDTDPLAFTPGQLEQLRAELGTRPHRGWRRALTVAALVLAVAAAARAGWAAGHAHPRVIDRTRTVVHTVTRTRPRPVTRWRTRATTITQAPTVPCWLVTDNGGTQGLYPDRADFSGTVAIQEETCTVTIQPTEPWTLTATDPGGHTFTVYATTVGG